MAYFLRVLNFAFQDFVRNIWLSVVTISILVLTLLSINVLVIFNVLANTAIDLVEERVDVSVYFKPGVDEDQVLSIRQYLSSLPEVATVEYVSPEQALADFRSNFSDDDVIISAVDELSDNPLGASLRVKARNLDVYPEILAALDRTDFNQYIEHKEYQDRQQIIGTISNWIDTGKQVVWGFIIFFSVISGLIVFNTIRVAIYTHREEITIEKLVGATNWFVRLPFVASAIIYAIISVLVTIAVLYPLFGLIQPFFNQFFGAGTIQIIQYFNQHFLTIFGLQLAAVVLLNVVASLTATRRYLRV